MNFKLFFIILLLVLGANGCTTVAELTTPAPPVPKHGRPIVYIHPLDPSAYRQATVGVLPFVVPENIEQEIGQQVGVLFKDILLAKRIFPKVKRIKERIGDTADAIKAGQSAGTDMVLVGQIHYLIEGSELGGAKVEVSVRLINVMTGNTVWYLGQNMNQPMDYPKDDILHRAGRALAFGPSIKRSDRPPALANMLGQIAVDMADIMAGAQYVNR